MPQKTETRVLKIKIDTQGSRELQRISKDLGSLNKSAKSLAGGFGFFRNAFTGFIASIGVGRIVEMSDQMQKLDNRLQVVTGSQEAAARAMDSISKIADETNQSISEVAESYTRIATPLKRLGVSAEFMADTTKSLINSFRIAGSTGNEVTATIVQLSQAFSSGTLRGQELRSVLLQNATLSELLFKKFGSELFKKAEAGLISVADVLRIIVENADSFNERAKVLEPTIGETLTKATNKFRLAVFELNKELGISGKFAKGVDLAIANLYDLSVIVVALSLTQLPKLLAVLGSISKALLAFAFTPWGAALLAVSGIIIYTTDSIEELEKKLSSLGDTITTSFSFSKKLGLQLLSLTSFGRKLSQLKIIDSGHLKEVKEDISDIKGIQELIAGLQRGVFQDNKPGYGVRETEEQRRARELRELEERQKKLAGSTGIKFEEFLKELNARYLEGSINASQYADALNELNLGRLNKDFKEGKTSLEEYNQKALELSKIEITRKFNEGALSIENFNFAIESLKLEELNNKLIAGKISLQEYDQEIVKIQSRFDAGSSWRAGVTSYIESIGTVSSQVADAVKNAFGSLENYFNDFIKTGKFEFTKFAQSILDDLQRIIIRASIIQPLANALLGGPSAGTSVSGGTYTDVSSIAAKGNAYDGSNVLKFAKGGLVNSPTMFGYGSSKLGLMGEAGPEAILPLARGSGGDLGVKASVTPVNINIINNSSAQIETKETTGPNGDKTIEVVIFNKVKQGISSGAFDKTFQQNFGLNRKGS